MNDESTFLFVGEGLDPPGHFAMQNGIAAGDKAFISLREIPNCCAIWAGGASPSPTE